MNVVQCWVVVIPGHLLYPHGVKAVFTNLAEVKEFCNEQKKKGIWAAFSIVQTSLHTAGGMLF